MNDAGEASSGAMRSKARSGAIAAAASCGRGTASVDRVVRPGADRAERRRVVQIEELRDSATALAEDQVLGGRR